MPRNVQLASHWEAGKWEVDGTHNSLVTVGNGGNKPELAQLTILYNQGKGQYQIEKMLAPDEQMILDFGKLIHEGVPDKNSQTLPPDLNSGAYRILDLTDHAAGGLYEGKVIVDKRFGHAAYGCAICCGPNNPYMVYNPLLVPVGGSSGQQIDAINSCTKRLINVTSDFPTWWTGNTSIATASQSQINGIAVGSTDHDAQSILMYWGPIADSGGQPCPLDQLEPSGGTDVNPTVTFGATPLVPIGKPVQTTATVNPPTNTSPITLTISTTSGTGSATFGNGYSTMTITTTTSVTLVGVTASSTPNNMQVTAKVGSASVGSTTFTVTGPINGAIPINFRQTSTSLDPDAVLTFHYTWDSSSGNKADLSTCQVEEYVTYVGPNPYPWASPPYLPGYVTSWPSTGGTPVSASVCGLVDHQVHQPGWLKPYVYNFTASNQQYQFQCPYYQNNQWVQLMPITGTIAISRVINYYNSNPNSWYYEVAKSGLSNSINLP